MTRSIYRPVKHKYREVGKHGRTVFVSLPAEKDLRPYQVADACRATLGSIQRNVCEDAQIWSSGICVLRVRHKINARKLAGRHIRLGYDELKVWPYPKHHPQVFIAQISHDDACGIRMDSVHINVAECIERVPFHMQTHFAEDERLSTCVITFQRPLKVLCFDVGVQTIGGQHALAQFKPAERLRSCALCRPSQHSVWKCDLLTEMEAKDVPSSMKDERHLFFMPKIL